MILALRLNVTVVILTAGARHPRSNNRCCERALIQLQGISANLLHVPYITRSL